MAVIRGENGSVYFNEGLTDPALANSITFGAGTTGATDQTITSSTDHGATGKINFETEGYTTGMLVTVSGCSSGSSTGNDRIYTINAVSSGRLTVNETVTTGTDTGTPVFLEAEPGIEVLGFYNWTLSYTGDALETTNFDNSSGGRNYIPGLTSWTATADKYFLTANNEVDDWVGGTCELRLFLNYVVQTTGAPSTGSPSQYWKGDTVVTGLDETTPVDALITKSISFQGDNTLTLKTQTQPWSSGISA